MASDKATCTCTSTKNPFFPQKIIACDGLDNSTPRVFPSRVVSSTSTSSLDFFTCRRHCRFSTSNLANVNWLTTSFPRVRNKLTTSSCSKCHHIQTRNSKVPTFVRRRGRGEPGPFVVYLNCVARLGSERALRHTLWTPGNWGIGFLLHDRREDGGTLVPGSKVSWWLTLVSCPGTLVK